jgi:hypothetical protein
MKKHLGYTKATKIRHINLGFARFCFETNQLYDDGDFIIFVGRKLDANDNDDDF